MSKLKSTKPICYRWYKILAGIAVCIICFVIWIFIINPLLIWDKDFATNLLKKLSSNNNNEIIGKKNISDYNKNLTITQDEKFIKNTTIYPYILKEINNSILNQKIQNNALNISTKINEKILNNTYLLPTTKTPLKTFFQTSTIKTTTLKYTKIGLPVSKIYYKIPENYRPLNYTPKGNIFKTMIKSTTQIPSILDNKHNFFDKKINVSKNTNYLNQIYPYQQDKVFNIIRNGKFYEKSTMKTIYKLTTTTKSTYSSPKNNTYNFKNQSGWLVSNNTINNTTKMYSNVTQYPKIKNHIINSIENNLSTKKMHPQNEILFNTTIPSTTIKQDFITSTTTFSTTVTSTEKLLPITSVERTNSILTDTSIVTSTVRSQLFANENNFIDKNNIDNIKIDKNNIVKNNAPVIVTALLDIGRGEWQSFYRPFETYLNSFLDLLQLDNNMIIYGDKTVINFVKKHFKNYINDKLLLEISMKDLPFYRYKKEMQDIIDHEQKNWNSTWDKRMKNHPESLYADYNILVNSKPYFLYNASIISPFSSDIFIWIDAGYSHGDKNLIPKTTWDPFLIPNKVHIIKLTPKQDQINTYTYDRVYRKDISVISAGFIGASHGVINRFYNFFYKTFIELLDDKKVDDDQTVILITIKNYASLFYVIHGGWFDAFRLLPNLDNTYDKEELRLRYNPRLYQSTYPYWKIHNNSTRDQILN
ncbi:HtrL protein family-containing protein [Strongyloides ratti]|uniref:HtrL protein family-containing protein n=1 Tax=Strongyloides ratti TaxID=34506 RepID=A0A090L6P5_STRRB|nr:HtrL protein family-containing protein [Strongyloides ratti]CEF63159.1 HtrL protein family-containing protein [Strongyloides ratti]